jgi:hypothetical protein
LKQVLGSFFHIPADAAVYHGAIEWSGAASSVLGSCTDFFEFFDLFDFLIFERTRGQEFVKRLYQNSHHHDLERL